MGLDGSVAEEGVEVGTGAVESVGSVVVGEVGVGLTEGVKSVGKSEYLAANKFLHTQAANSASPLTTPCPPSPEAADVAELDDPISGKSCPTAMAKSNPNPAPFHC